MPRAAFALFRTFGTASLQILARGLNYELCRHHVGAGRVGSGAAYDRQSPRQHGWKSRDKRAAQYHNSRRGFYDTSHGNQRHPQTHRDPQPVELPRDVLNQTSIRLLFKFSKTNSNQASNWRSNLDRQHWSSSEQGWETRQDAKGRTTSVRPDCFWVPRCLRRAISRCRSIRHEFPSRKSHLLTLAFVCTTPTANQANTSPSS